MGSSMDIIKRNFHRKDLKIVPASKWVPAHARYWRILGVLPDEPVGEEISVQIYGPCEAFTAIAAVRRSD